MQETAASTGSTSDKRRNMRIIGIISKMEIQTYPDVGDIEAQPHLRCAPRSRHIAGSIFLVLSVELESAQPERQRTAHVREYVNRHARIEGYAPLHVPVLGTLRLPFRGIGEDRTAH